MKSSRGLSCLSACSAFARTSRGLHNHSIVIYWLKQKIFIFISMGLCTKRLFKGLWISFWVSFGFSVLYCNLITVLLTTTDHCFHSTDEEHNKRQKYFDRQLAESESKVRKRHKKNKWKQWMSDSSPKRGKNSWKTTPKMGSKVCDSIVSRDSMNAIKIKYSSLTAVSIERGGGRVGGITNNILMCFSHAFKYTSH